MFAGGLEPQALELRRDVLGGLPVADVARLAAAHGVIGYKEEASAEIGGGDRRMRLRGLGRQGGRGGEGSEQEGGSTGHGCSMGQVIARAAGPKQSGGLSDLIASSLRSSQ